MVLGERINIESYPATVPMATASLGSEIKSRHLERECAFPRKTYVLMAVIFLRKILFQNQAMV